MIRSMTIVACLTLSACAVPIMVPAPAPAPDPEPIDAPQSAKARFVTSVAANGCALTSANTDVIMADAVLSREDLARVMTELRAEGRGEIDGAAFRVTSGVCA
ncbi:hypothetical protein [Roseobacter sp. CCS2]|uniref:hypothetical protein n=1 Tax=Roseobacter sp. CCS2 TaxID=391593 RepID=UPI0000F40556|nr:hypothetical protein [Roseobacter sp. CCS2]EBA11490.1 NADH dehydrogenase subunit D [Roseobacter sp. CCS2]